MAKSRLDFAAAYKANKENNAVTEAKIAEGKAIAEAQSTARAKKKAESEPKAEKDEKPVAESSTKAKPREAKRSQASREEKPAAAPKKKVGRPASKTTVAGEETTLRSFYLTSRQIAAIDLTCAKDKELSKTDVVRMALDEYFEANGIYKAVELLGL